MRDIYLNFDDIDKIEEISNALSSSFRLKIIQLLMADSFSLQELANKLDLAMSTVSFHIKILKEAGIVKVLPSPSKKGNEKNISLNVETILFNVASSIKASNKTYLIELPIGSFSSYDIVPPCSICTDKEVIKPLDDPLIFDSSYRMESQLLSFSKGWIEYSILTHEFRSHKINSITFSMEICSECPNYNEHWKSDITFWVNNIEVTTFRSMGDYGGRRGNFTPQWWANYSTQYGMLVNLTINNEGTFINGEKVGDITLKEVNPTKNLILSFKIGVKENARYVGGVNIFGKNFGDYQQGINFIVDYEVK